MPKVKTLKRFETKYDRAIARPEKLGETILLTPRDYKELSEREGGPYFADIESKKDGVRREKQKASSSKHRKSKEVK